MLDIHTHLRENRFSALYSLTPPRGFVPEAGVSYALGIHPWVEAEYRAGLFCSWEELEALVARPEVRAVGEAGLDRVHRPLPDLPAGCLHRAPQSSATRVEEGWRRSLKLLEEQALLAERVGKPLLLHCVRAADEVLALQKRLRPQVPWVWHGFRGGAEQARQLVRRGLCLSLGEHFRAETACSVPVDHLLIETDESTLPIEAILLRVAVARCGTPAEKLRHFSAEVPALSTESGSAFRRWVQHNFPQGDDLWMQVAALREELEGNVRRLFGS